MDLCTYLLLSASHTVTLSQVKISINLSDMTEIIKLLSAILSLIIIIVGVRAIKELKLRGIDAICGFHAKLKVRLINLQRAAQISKIKPLPAEQTAFMWFSLEKTKNLLSGRMNCFSEDKHLKTFIFHAEETLKHFEQSDGQIPLNLKMYNDFNELYLTLLDIIDAKNNGTPLVINSIYPNSSILSDETEISNKAKAFDDLIDRVIKGINVNTPRLLKDLWKKTK